MLRVLPVPCEQPPIHSRPERQYKYQQYNEPRNRKVLCEAVKVAGVERYSDREVPIVLNVKYVTKAVVWKALDFCSVLQIDHPGWVVSFRESEVEWPCRLHVDIVSGRVDSGDRNRGALFAGFNSLTKKCELVKQDR